MATAVTAIISADTAAIIGSIDSVAYMYIRTGSVTVAGEVTKIDIVSSSKLLMKASSQPPVMPGRIIGSVMRLNTVDWLAPSDSAACSALRSKSDQRRHHQPQRVRRDDHDVGERRANRSCRSPPTSANRRSSATPSTRCGMISGDRNRPLRKSRPGNS